VHKGGSDATLQTPDGRDLLGLTGMSTRRKRYCWLMTAPQQLTTLVLHDKDRDRLLFVQSTDEQTARLVGATVGIEPQLVVTEDL
jgi:hypothetical protein